MKNAGRAGGGGESEAALAPAWLAPAAAAIFASFCLLFFEAMREIIKILEKRKQNNSRGQLLKGEKSDLI